MEIPKNIQGRYIKVLKTDLGGHSSKYEKGSYLKILRDNGNKCILTEYAGALHVREGNTRFHTGHIELMPEGFDPNIIDIFYEIY